MISFEEALLDYPYILGVHPAANLLPMASEVDLTSLVNDVSAHGLAEPIILEQGTDLLIDGRNRVIACSIAQIEPTISRTIIDPWSVSISRNLARRNLTTGQRAMVGESLKEHYQEEAKDRMEEGGRSGNVALPSQGQSRDKIAEVVGVGSKAIDKACFIVDESTDIADKVRSNEVTLETGYKAARKQKSERERIEKPPAVEKETTLVVTTDGTTYEVNLPKKVVFNKTNENVDWAGYTWNPVTGCKHGCTFCYAEDIATQKKMLPFYPAGFEPIFREYQMDAPMNTKVNGRVFVCSMADLFGKWVPDEWIQKVFSAAMTAPEWEYMFLTKWPNRYKMLTDLPKAWFGASVIKQSDVARVEREMQSFETTGIKWVSLEPMLEPIVFSDLSWCDVVVIGSQTAANGQPAFAPDFAWVVDVFIQCRAANVKFYMKPNLMEIAPGMVLPREMPTL